MRRGCLNDVVVLFSTRSVLGVVKGWKVFCFVDMRCCDLDDDCRL